MTAIGRNPDGASLKILVVDDDPTNLFVLDQFLRSEGVDTIVATNGVEAVELYERYSPSLVLMDLSMPVMDGFEATRRILEIAEQESGRPIVVAVSANVTPEWRENCFEAGMIDFIEKPIDFHNLVSRLAALVAAQAR